MIDQRGNRIIRSNQGLRHIQPVIGGSAEVHIKVSISRKRIGVGIESMRRIIIIFHDLGHGNSPAAGKGMKARCTGRRIRRTLFIVETSLVPGNRDHRVDIFDPLFWPDLFGKNDLTKK